MLTCACGARFEVDDTLAGQEVLCPECQQPLKAPALERPPQVTSGWALTSVVLALVGALTVVGTVAAVVTGFIALVHIARHRERVAGVGFATFGIVLGLLFTGLTVSALATSDLFGLDGWLRQRTLAQDVDTSGPMEIVRGAQGFAITRPTEKWGQVQGNHSGDPAVFGLQMHRDLLLMQVARHAFLDVRVLPRNNFLTLEQCENDVLAEFKNQRPSHFGEDDDEDFPQVGNAQVRRSQKLPPRDGADAREVIVDARCAGHPWHFVIHLYRRNGVIYIVRAYAPVRRLSLVEGELQTGLDSFRLLPR